TCALTIFLVSFIVLIQYPIGGVLASGFAGGTNFMGVKRTGDILEKGTWGLMIAIMLFSMVMNVIGPSSGGPGGLSDQITPQTPTTAPPPATETPEILLETDTAQ